MSEAATLEARIRREDEEALRRLKPLMTTRLRLLGARIPMRAIHRHAGTVRLLCKTAHTQHERNPRLSLELATQACEVALKLDAEATTPPRYCQGLALRERANALRYLGRFTEALEALDAAEPLFDGGGAGDAFDLAVVLLIRATVLHEVGRLIEAADIANRARTIFADYGDPFRELSAFMLEAGCLMFTGDLATAGPMFERAVALAAALGDAATQARALSNAAMVYSRRGELDEAEPRYLEALLIFEEVGLMTELARTNWELANLSVKRGQLARGANLLSRAREELAAAGMTNDYALATLDWAAVRLGLGRTKEVAEACRRIVVVFESEGMTREARRALASLQEALAHGTATSETVHRVRKFIEDLPRNPDLRFVASPS
jgi:tetratricopeptide (TPR) repeat protein